MGQKDKEDLSLVRQNEKSDPRLSYLEKKLDIERDKEQKAEVDKKIVAIKEQLFELNNVQGVQKLQATQPKENVEEKDSNSHGRWTSQEHIKFLKGCIKYGNNWKKVETYYRINGTWFPCAIYKKENNFK